MREILKVKELQNKIVDLAFYEKNIAGENNEELVLYSDNVLEGITLLNSLVVSTDEILKLYAVLYEPVDQPIYIFQDKKKRFFSLKVCGSFENWDLPDEVHDLESFIDIPDYAIFSVSKERTIVAGENTETASVGNSQWQREGRKIGSAINKVPFIYQTFYSGKDESQDTIREPSSLQVYNHLIYSVRYITPSFSVYLENNFENANVVRKRKIDGEELLVKYIKTLIVFSIDESYLLYKKELEKKLYKHMLDYVSEGRLKKDCTIETEARLLKDFPIINKKVQDAILDGPNSFIDDIVELLNSNYNKEEFVKKYPFDELNWKEKSEWTSYDNKTNINILLSEIRNKGEKPYSYVKKAKIGLVNTDIITNCLKDFFPKENKTINNIFSSHPETLLIPLRIHKKSNGELVFCPDPESGEIAAFVELFSYNIFRKKIRPVLGYCIVDTPSGFDLNSKSGTKLYKSIANYIDFLVINNKEIYYKFNKHDKYLEKYLPNNIKDLKPIKATEEVAIVSTFLNLSTIKADWNLCFIHTHHSSWQQLMVYKNSILEKMKIHRNASKVDLVMQEEENNFFIAEGKKNYKDFFVTQKEMEKISKGMSDTKKNIDKLMGKKTNKIYSLVPFSLLTLVCPKPQEIQARENLERIASCCKEDQDTKYLRLFFLLIYLHLP